MRKGSTWLQSEWVLGRATQNIESLRSLLVLQKCVSQWTFKGRKAFRVFSATQFRSVPKLPGAASAKAHYESKVPSAYFLPDHICGISKNYQDNFSQGFLHGIKCHFHSESQKIFSFSCTYRKKCLLCTNVLMIMAASIMGCSKISHSFEMILVGRFMCGISAGE